MRYTQNRVFEQSFMSFSPFRRVYVITPISEKNRHTIETVFLEKEWSGWNLSAEFSDRGYGPPVRGAGVAHLPDDAWTVITAHPRPGNSAHIICERSTLFQKHSLDRMLVLLRKFHDPVPRKSEGIGLNSVQKRGFECTSRNRLYLSHFLSNYKSFWHMPRLIV